MTHGRQVRKFRSAHHNFVVLEDVTSGELRFAPASTTHGGDAWDDAFTLDDAEALIGEMQRIKAQLKRAGKD